MAGYLSRAFVKDTGADEEEFQVFALESEAMSPLDTVKISRERLSQLQKVTALSNPPF